MHKIENTTSEQIGDSFEGREINVFKINANNKDLPAVIMDAGTEWRESRILCFFKSGIHAREWISPASVMYFTEVGDLVMRVNNVNLSRKRWKK